MVAPAVLVMWQRDAAVAAPNSLSLPGQLCSSTRIWTILPTPCRNTSCYGDNPYYVIEGGDELGFNPRNDYAPDIRSLHRALTGLTYRGNIIPANTVS